MFTCEVFDMTLGLFLDCLSVLWTICLLRSLLCVLVTE